MKKLIKFLFPFIYKEIMNEGVETYLNTDNNSDYLRPDEDDYYLDEHEQEAWDKKCEEDRIAYRLEEEAEKSYLSYSKELPCKVGDFVHLKSPNGIYEVIGTSVDYFTVTCKKWQEEYLRKGRKFDSSVYSWSNFKCLDG